MDEKVNLTWKILGGIIAIVILTIAAVAVGVDIGKNASEGTIKLLEQTCAEKEAALDRLSKEFEKTKIDLSATKYNTADVAAMATTGAAIAKTTDQPKDEKLPPSEEDTIETGETKFFFGENISISVEGIRFTTDPYLQHRAYLVVNVPNNMTKKFGGEKGLSTGETFVYENYKIQVVSTDTLRVRVRVTYGGRMKLLL